MTGPAVPPLRVGEQRVVERTFTAEEVEAFARLTGDLGDQHVTGDGSGRRMVHGLLVGSLPTQVGGELNFLAREMVYEFVRPAFTGELLRCTVTLTGLEPSSKGTRLEASFECLNPHGQVVMKGHGRGLVPGPSVPGS